MVPETNRHISLDLRSGVVKIALNQPEPSRGHEVLPLSVKRFASTLGAAAWSSA
jgi:hypothetical protein